MTDQIETYSVEEVAHFLGKPATFGVAVRGSGGRYSYLIPKRKFQRWLEMGDET